MTPPAFWQRPPQAPGIRARALAPLSLIWRTVTARRLAAAPQGSAGIPVICVGNLTVGGTGKTPTVCYLLDRLTARGVAAHALSRGYGGRIEGPARVDPRSHSAADVGDEPLLLSGFGPAWVSRDRLAGARAIAAAGGEAVVMDDGLQNPALAKDLSIVVIDAEAGFGNGRVVPAGPLREPVASGLRRADLALSIGPGEAQERLEALWPQLSGLPRLRGRLEPLETGMPWAGLRCLAFAGIGRPAKFFQTLRSLGAEVVAERAFPDHAAYPQALVQRLINDAARMRAQLVTTEKDAVRLPPDIRPGVLTLPVRLRLDDTAPLDAALDRLFEAR